MASTRSSWLQRKILFKIPGLYKVCPGGNYHPFYQRLCFCRVGEHVGGELGSGWHGGIYDFKTKDEYQYCEICQMINLKSQLGEMVDKIENNGVDLNSNDKNEL